MRGELKNEGNYELFETDNGNQILSLNDEDYYALVEGEEGDIIIKSDSDHKKEKTISEGSFYYVDFEDDPEFQDMPHLFMEDGDQFRELILPENLPKDGDYQKKLIRSDEKLPKNKVLNHVKGKGNKGSEEQYSEQAEGLRKKTKEELYDEAQKKNIEGRSKMDKKELIEHLSDE